MKKLAIIGASGMGKEAIWIAESMNCFSEIIILDDNFPTINTILNRRIYGKIEAASQLKDHEFCIAIGNPRLRKKIFETLIDLGINKFTNLIHSSAAISPYVKLGFGNIFGPMSVISVDVTIGNFNIINNGSTIAHDCRISNFCTIAPLAAISGSVILSDLVEVGTGASIRQNLFLNKGTMLGMGSNLTKNIEIENHVFVGNSAKFYKEI